MLKKLSITEAFTAVPWLGDTTLMKTQGNAVKFSVSKPNVIVGPNGAGKSALVRTIALRFLADLCGKSQFDGKYVKDYDYDCLWTKTREWGNDYEFMKGLTVATDNAPAVYFRPGHIPGNEADVTHAMMTGYMEEARHFDKLTRNKSSGQKTQALLHTFEGVLKGAITPLYSKRDWSYGDEPVVLCERRMGYVGPWDHKAEVIKKVFESTIGLPLVLMDEPEQSLDALAEVKLWKAIEASANQPVQVIVATHSLYPLLNPKKFNILEAEPGYVARIKEELQLA